MKSNLLIGTSLVAAFSATSLEARSFSVMTEAARKDNTALSTAIHIVTEGHKRATATGKQALKAGESDVFVAAYNAAAAKVASGKDGKVAIAAIAAELAKNPEMRNLIAEFRAEIVAAVAEEKKAKPDDKKVAPAPEPTPTIVVDEVSLDDLTQAVIGKQTALIAAITVEYNAKKAVEDTAATVARETTAKETAEKALKDAEVNLADAEKKAAEAKTAAEQAVAALTKLNADRKAEAEAIAAAEKAINDKTAAGTAVTPAETQKLDELKASLALIDTRIVSATTVQTESAAAVIAADKAVVDAKAAVEAATTTRDDAIKALETAEKAKADAQETLKAKTEATQVATAELASAKAAVLAAAAKSTTEAETKATAATEASSAAEVKKTELATAAEAAKNRVAALTERQASLETELGAARAADAAGSTDATKATVKAKEAAVVAIAKELAEAKIAETHAAQALKNQTDVAEKAAEAAEKAAEFKTKTTETVKVAKDAVKAADEAVKSTQATLAQVVATAKAAADKAAKDAASKAAAQALADAKKEIEELERQLALKPGDAALTKALDAKKAELVKLTADADKAAAAAQDASDALAQANADLKAAQEAELKAVADAQELSKKLKAAQEATEEAEKAAKEATERADKAAAKAEELEAKLEELAATVDRFTAETVLANLIEETTAELAAAQARAETPGATPDAIADAQIDIEIANATLLSAKTLADLMAQVIVEAGGEYSGKIADRMNADIAETKANFVKDFNSGKFVVAELVESYIQSFERFAEKAEQFNKLKTLFDIDTSVRIDTKTPAGRIIDARSQIVAQLQAVLTSSVSSKTVKEAETLLFAMTKRFTQFDRTLGRFAAARGRGFADAALEELVTLQRALNSAVDEEALSMRNLLAQLSQINEISAQFDQVSQLELAEKAKFDALDAAAKPAAQADYDRAMADFSERKAKLASDVSDLTSQPAGALRAGDDEAVEQRISYAPHAAAAAAYAPADRVQNLTAEAIAALKKALKTYADFLTEISKATDIQLLSEKTVDQLFGTLVAGSSSDYVAGSGKAGLDQFLNRLSRFIPLHIISDSTVGRFADEIRTTADAAARLNAELIAKMDVASAALTTARTAATSDANEALGYLIANVYERQHQIAQIEAEKAEFASQLFTAPDKDAIQAEIDARSRRIEEINQWLLDNKKAIENATTAAGDLVGLFEAVRELRKQIAVQQATADAEARTMEADFATLRRLDAEVKNARQAKAEESVRFVVAIAEAVQTILSPALAEVEDEEAEEEAEEGSEHGSVHSGGSTPRRPASGSFGKVTPPLRAGTTGVAFVSGSGSTGAAAAAAVAVPAPKPAGKTAAQQIQDETDALAALAPPLSDDD